MKDNPWYFYVFNQLVKKPKPCLTDDYVHIKYYSGCYRVYSAKLHYFVVLKNREYIKIPWDEFVCLKGEGRSAEALIKRGIKQTLNNINYTMTLNQIMANQLTGILKDLRK